MCTDQVLFCDTIPIIAAFYSQVLFNSVSFDLEKAAKRQYNYYILCNNDIPFNQDGTRKNAEFRDYGYHFYKNWLDQCDYPFIEVGGSRQHRVELVLAALKNK